MNMIPEWVFVVRALVDCVGLGVFAWRMVPRTCFFVSEVSLSSNAGDRKNIGRLIVHILIFALMAAILVFIKTSRLPFYIDILCNVILFTVYLFATRRTSIGNALYASVVVFLCMDFCVALCNYIYRAAPLFEPAEPYVIEGIYLVVLIVLCVLLRHFAPVREGAKLPPAAYVALILALLPYIVIRSTEAFYDMEGTSGIAMQAVLFLTIIATFGTVASSRFAVTAEAERAQRLELEMEINEQQHRFEVRKETMAEVNRRYHDMVRYAHIFAESGADGSLDDYLEHRMTDDLAVGVLHETGNTALDAIIWETDEACRQHDIRFIPAADGEILSFVSSFDLRTIVGNALDNAVEAASAVEDPEKREVRFKLSQVNQMAFMRVENYFSGTLRRQADQLLTTKDDESSHGFGLDNIRRAVASYEGSVRFEVEDDRFTLTVMIPIPE